MSWRHCNYSFRLWRLELCLFGRPFELRSVLLPPLRPPSVSMFFGNIGQFVKIGAYKTIRSAHRSRCLGISRQLIEMIDIREATLRSGLLCFRWRHGDNKGV